MKKLLSILLIAALLLTCIPLGMVSVSAATSGTTGVCTWTLDDNGHLTISGNGAMADYEDWNAPWDSSAISSVTIEEGVTSIGNYAFIYCSELTSVSLSETISRIGVSAFDGCYNLCSVSLPKSVAEIGDSAFDGCGFTTVFIPENVVSIGKEAFMSCHDLAAIEVDENNLRYTSDDGVLIDKSELTLLQYPRAKRGAYTVPEGIVAIGDSAFRQADALTSVVIPDSVRIIGDDAFFDCDQALTSVVMGDSIETIGLCAFAVCDELTSLDIPERVTQIKYGTFMNCSALTTITLPASVTVIDDRAFDECEKLTDVYYTGALSDRWNIAFGNKNDAIRSATWHYDYVRPCKVHTYKKVITKATLTKDGKSENVCTKCGYKASKVTTIYKASKISLSKTSYTYNGKVQKPSVVVKDSAGKTISSSNYTVKYASGLKNAGTYKVTVTMKGNYSGTKTLTYKINGISVSKCKISLSKTSYTYNGKAQKPSVTVKSASGSKLTTSSYTVTYASGRKNVGTYKVTIKMKGNYTGTKTLTFKINPPKTTVKATAAKKSLKLTIGKKSTQVTGYEVQYSTSKSFKNYKSKTLTSYKKTSLTLTGLKAKTTYYVRVRTYKTVGGKKYYSGWSTIVYKKTK